MDNTEELPKAAVDTKGSILQRFYAAWYYIILSDWMSTSEKGIKHYFIRVFVLLPWRSSSAQALVAFSLRPKEHPARIAKVSCLATNLRRLRVSASSRHNVSHNSNTCLQ